MTDTTANTNGNGVEPERPKKTWIMNAFAMSSPGHVNAG